MKFIILSQNSGEIIIADRLIVINNLICAECNGSQICVSEYENKVEAVSKLEDIFEFISNSESSNGPIYIDLSECED